MYEWSKVYYLFVKSVKLNRYAWVKIVWEKHSIALD
jgi:hypothetical protein